MEFALDIFMIKKNIYIVCLILGDFIVGDFIVG